MPGLLRRAWRAAADTVGSLAVRRWEAAKTGRLNAGHWKDATGEKLNDAIAEDGETLVARCTLERDRNGYVAGVMRTHATDIVGEDGPSLQLQSDDPEYDAEFKQVFDEWWARPDLNGVLSGVDFLTGLVNLRWTHGESLWQMVDDEAVPRGSKRLSLRLHDVNPTRLVNPLDPGAARIKLGVERDRYGRPLAYWIDEDDDDSFSFVPERFDAKDVIHDFDRLEPGQIRGIPFLAPVLQVVADLRDYDAAVLDAARIAADYCILLVSDHPDAEFVLVNETTPVKRRQISTAPPGWKPFEFKAQHPTTNYVEFRKERLRELGRPVGMPLLVVQSDASNHNYSSARFDSQTYHRGNRAFQGRVSRGPLARVVDAVAAEAELRGMTRKRPRKVWHVWTWPVPPHVDPTKEANAAKTRLETGTSTIADELAVAGKDLETHVDALEREIKLYREKGLRHPADLQAAGNAATPPASGNGQPAKAARSGRRNAHEVRVLRVAV